MSSIPRYTVVIPVLNQLHYTQQCVESLIAGGTPAEAILVIDNGSSDATPQWLASRPDLGSRVPCSPKASGWCCSTTTW